MIQLSKVLEGYSISLQQIQFLFSSVEWILSSGSVAWIFSSESVGRGNIYIRQVLDVLDIQFSMCWMDIQF